MFKTNTEKKYHIDYTRKEIYDNLCPVLKAYFLTHPVFSFKNGNLKNKAIDALLRDLFYVNQAIKNQMYASNTQYPINEKRINKLIHEVLINKYFNNDGTFKYRSLTGDEDNKNGFIGHNIFSNPNITPDTKISDSVMVSLYDKILRIKRSK